MTGRRRLLQALDQLLLKLPDQPACQDRECSTATNSLLTVLAAHQTTQQVWQDENTVLQVGV